MHTISSKTDADADSARQLSVPFTSLVGREAEQSNLPRPNLAAEDTYGGGGEDEVRGRREDGVEEVAAAKRFVSGVDAS